MRWKNTSPEPDIRSDTQALMQAAGLRCDTQAVDVGIGIVRECVANGDNVILPEDAGRRAAEKQLAVPTHADDGSPDTDELLERLPPTCRAGVRALRSQHPDTASRLAQLLDTRQARTPGVLVHILDDPPDWIPEGDCTTFEVIASFLNAHDLPGAASARQAAVRDGSSMGDLQLLAEARRAIAADKPRDAQRLLRGVDKDHPLLDATRSLLDRDATAVLAKLRASAALESSDAEIASTAAAMRIWALQRLERAEDAARAAGDARQRFPDRASMHLAAAHMLLDLAFRRERQGSPTSDLFKDAAKAALRARDLFRSWNGPSGPAVAVAAASLMPLGELETVRDLTTPAPAGQANRQESEHPDVVTQSALTLLALVDIDSLEPDLLDQSRSPGDGAAVFGAQLDSLDLGLVGGHDHRMLQALRARLRGDRNALELMREAVSEAGDDREKFGALRGLAMMGEDDEVTLRCLGSVKEPDKDLIRALASHHRNDCRSVIRLLESHSVASAEHAALLAQAQRELGAGDDAIDTLLHASRTLSDAALHSNAVELLVTGGRLEDAETAALEALAGPSPPDQIELRLRQQLLQIANQRQDWPKTRDYARRLLVASPGDSQAVWAIINSYIAEGDPQTAWRTVLEHDAAPFDALTATLAIVAYPSEGASPADCERLLDIAAEFADDPDIGGPALAAVMPKGGDTQMGESEQARFMAALEHHTQQHGDNATLRLVEGANIEDVVEMLESVVPAQSVEFLRTRSLVRVGQAPYGVLRAELSIPYAELLASRAAGQITAVSVDEDDSGRERRAAQQALGGVVTVDTSVAAVAAHAGLDLRHLTSLFKRVLVADALVADAATLCNRLRCPRSGKSHASLLRVS